MTKTLRFILPLFLLVPLVACDLLEDDDPITDPISLGPLAVTVSVTVTPSAAANDGICRLNARADVAGGDAAETNNYFWTAASLRRASSSWSDTGSSLDGSFQVPPPAGGHPIELVVERGEGTVRAADIVFVNCGAATVSTTVFGS